MDAIAIIATITAEDDPCDGVYIPCENDPAPCIHCVPPFTLAHTRAIERGGIWNTDNGYQIGRWRVASLNPSASSIAHPSAGVKRRAANVAPGATTPAPGRVVAGPIIPGAITRGLTGRAITGARSRGLVELLDAPGPGAAGHSIPGASRARRRSWPGSRGLPAELVERLVEHEAVARELSRPPGKLPAIEQPGPPGAHRGRRRASSMAPGARELIE